MLQWKQACSMKEDKVQRRKAESIVDIDVCGSKVQVLVPPKRVSAADLMVCLDPQQLEATLEFLQPDCHALLSKRKYSKTGRFKRDQPEEENSDKES